MADNPLDILNVKAIDCRSLCWARSTLAHDQVVRWSTAKVRVYSDSELCLGKMSSGEEAKARWSSQVKEFQVYSPVEEFPGIDGVAIEFEWNISLSQDSQHCRFFKRSRMICKSGTSNRNNSLTESSSCQCSTTSIGQKRNDEETCTSN